MLDAIRSEQYKTRHTKIFTILCVGALVLGVITVYMNHSMYMAGKIKELSGENALKSGMSNISVAIILCSIFLDVNLGSEFQNRTLQLSASFGNNRKIIFVSKGIVNIFYSVILSFLYPMVLTCVTTMLYGWTNDTFSFGMIFLKLLVTILLEITIFLMCFGVEFIMEGSKAGLLFNVLVIGIGFPILQSLGEKINLIKRILEVTPIGYLDVWVKQDIDINFIAKILIIVVVWSISTLSLSYIIFKRRDLCSLRPLAVANAFFNGRYAEQNGRSYLVDC